MGGCKEIAKLSIAERLALAKAKTERVVDHVLYVLELHENNEIIVYSPTLRSQIPTSYAANAFIVFRHGLHQFEIVRLCAPWDGVELDQENIPTIIELIDHPDVIEALAQETGANWKGEEFGEQQAQRAREELRAAVEDSRAILAGSKLESMMNLRNKYLAHSLTETRRDRARRERKDGSIDPMKYGDERQLLNDSMPIVQALFCWVNGKSFNFENSREINRENAKALWEACTFDIKR
jgi:hypothetical protein